MTADARAVIRAAVDAAARARVERERLLELELGMMRTCFGCGADLDACTDGCRACSDRHRRRWRRRHDPAFLERERRQVMESKRRQRAAAA